MFKKNQIQATFFLLPLALLTVSSGCFSADSPDGQPQAVEVEPDANRVVSQVPAKYDHLEQFLDNDEQAVVAAVHEKYLDILENWHAEHGEKIRSGRAAVFDFMKTKNKAEARAAMKQAKQDNVKELILEERETQDEYDAAVLAAIPVDKLKLWQADKISRTLLDFLAPLEFAEAQIKQVHDLAPTAIQKIPARNNDDWHPIGTTNLETLVGQSVLTPAQKQPFEELKQKHRMRKLKWAL